jgi:hypothetical protein
MKVELKAKLLLEFPKQADANQLDFGSLSPLSIEELSNRDTQEDCLVGIHGTKAYDLTRFAGHPGGKQSKVSLCGTDSTSISSSMHSANILPRVQEQEDHSIQFGAELLMCISPFAVESEVLDESIERSLLALLFHPPPQPYAYGCSWLSSMPISLYSTRLSQSVMYHLLTSTPRYNLGGFTLPSLSLYEPEIESRVFCGISLPQSISST